MLRKLSTLLLTLCLLTAALTPWAAAAGAPRLVTSSQQAASQQVGFDRLPADCQSLQATFTLSADTPCGFVADSALSALPGVYTTWQQSGPAVTVYVTAKSGVLTENGSLTLGTISSSDGTTLFTVEKATDLKLLGTASDETSYPAADSGSGSSGSVSARPITVQGSTGGKVTASAAQAAQGKVVTLTASPNSGYTLKSLSVTDAAGRAVALTSLGGSKYTFVMPASAVTVSALFEAEAVQQPQLPFTDVADGSWYADSVRYVYEQGLMGGTGEGRFSPDLTTSRAMIVTILYRLEGSPAVTGGTSFADVADGQWYSDGVAWASANGIVTGYSNGSFGPDDTITREQMAAILCRYASYKGYDVSVRAPLTGYTDAGQVSAYAAEAMSWAVGSGLITGTGQSTLSPAGSATRAQAAVILARFCQTVAG